MGFATGLVLAASPQPRPRATASVAEPQLVDALPEAVLGEVIGMLACADLARCTGVCSSWRSLLDDERQWEGACRQQWPAVQLGGPSGDGVIGTWRELAAIGGGDHMGSMLLEKLRDVFCSTARCSKGHLVARSVLEFDGHTCETCGQHLQRGAELWGCVECDGGQCTTCYKALEAAPLEHARGASNRVDHMGWSALHYACRLGFREVAQHLIDARADMESTSSSSGRTPLMISAIHDHKDVCELLVSHGASKETMGPTGTRAVDLAQKWGSRDDLVSLLAAS